MSEPMSAASINRIRRLVKKAQDNADKATAPASRTYWLGYRDGALESLRTRARA